MKELLEMFFVFCRVGAFTFGGGYAMLPIVQREVVDKKKWITYEEVVDYYAISQCLPGVIAVNTSTFIGYKVKGTLGAIAAAAGVVFPSLVIIITIASSIMLFQDNPIVQHAFAGIRVAVVVLVANAVINLWKRTVKDIAGAILFIAAFLIIALTKISPIIIIVLSAAIGIALSYRKAVEK